MAKKIEVFQSEYDYLTQFHKESTLELTQLRAERDRLQKDYDDLMKAFKTVCYEHDCKGCKHANNPEILGFCEQADNGCKYCKTPCPCRECDHGSNYEWDRGADDV